MMNKRKVLTLCLVTTMAGSTLCISGCRQKKETQPAVPRVKVISVGEKASGQSRRISGSLQTAKESALSFGVGGQVLEILPKEGDLVETGRPLARLDSKSLRITLEKAQAKLASSRASAEEAHQIYERTSKLAQQRGASQKELDAAKSGLASDRTSLQTAQGELDQARIDLEKTTLKAPFSGRVGSVSVDQFQEVSAGQTVITLLSEDAMEVQVRVPETMIRHVDYGQVVKIGFPSLPKTSTRGMVTKIAAEAADGNAFPVTVTLSGGTPDLRPGMTASVTFNFDQYLEGRTVYLIPISALAIDTALLHSAEYAPEDSSGRRTSPVYVLDTATGTVQERKVVVGELRDNSIEVYEGLKAGELVVTAGVAFLNDGMQAEQWNPETTPLR